MTTPTRRLLAGGVSLALAATVTAALGQTAATATPDAAEGSTGRAATHRPDNLPNPLAERQDALRRKAVERIVAGKLQPQAQEGGGSTVSVDGEAVEFFDNDKQANIWTVLSEFGDEASGRYGRGTGPLHNEIPAPDRSQDNTTQWTSDFSVGHYEELFNGDGESFRDYYLAVSNGQYTATNFVEDWVQVPKNGNWYGDNANETQGYWTFIADTVNAWYDKQIADGKTPADIDAYLSEFDQWDRYDFDNDENFNEPDGYIDHFQAIHAGEGEEGGGGTLGADAIWSHRWYADYTTEGAVGPTLEDGRKNLLGGKQVGQSRYFVGDYTVEPENGGLGVFAHEYGHDLGLPDLYDTNGGENGTGFWTLMSSGSWLGHGSEATGFDVGIGGTPNGMGPEERLFLGWLNHETVAAGESGSFTLDPAGSNGAQAVAVSLPDRTSSTTYTAPYAGSMAWFSGNGNDLNNTLTRTVPAAGRVTVNAKGWYQTESGYDYLFAEYSLDGGDTWKQIGQPIDGASRGWTSMRFAYDAGGSESQFRFRYKTDGGVSEAGVFLDEIVGKDGRTTLFSDGAENGDGGWATDGWKRSSGTETATSSRYYLLENRAYAGYDDTLRTGPYNFSEGVTRPNWVEHFSYQDGMLVWMVDLGYADNNTSEHPGAGYALPVDARPAPLTWSDGSAARSRIQVFDATFGTQSTDATCLHRQVSDGSTQEMCAPARPGVPTFDDRNSYWSEATPATSVKVAGVGVTATVTSQDASTLTVAVTNPAP